jgi:hypothetical protein
MWSGRRSAVLGFLGVGRTFFGAGRRAVAFDFLGVGGAAALGAFGEGRATATVFSGAAGATVEEVLDRPGVAVDDGSAAVQAVDANSSIPAMVRLVHHGEPRTWNSPLDSKYSEFSIQRVPASKRKTWAGDGIQVGTRVIGDLYAIVEPQVGVSGSSVYLHFGQHPLLADTLVTAAVGRLTAKGDAMPKPPTPRGWPINFAHRGGAKVVPETRSKDSARDLHSVVAPWNATCTRPPRAPSSSFMMKWLTDNRWRGARS